SAATALAVAGAAAPESASQMPATLCAALFRPLCGSTGAAVAVSSAFFSALFCGAFYLALVAFFHLAIRPQIMRDDIRDGAFHAALCPRIAAFVAVVAFAASPAAARLSSGEVPGAVVPFLYATAFALLLHARSADAFTLLVAGAAIAGACAGVSPVAALAAPLAVAAIAIASPETDDRRDPVARFIVCLAAFAAAAAVSALIASAAFSAAAREADPAGAPRAARALAAHAAAMVAAMGCNDRLFGLEPGNLRFAGALVFAPFVVMLFSARPALSDDNRSWGLRIFNGAVALGSAVSLFGSSVSPVEAVAKTVFEAPAAAACASTLAYALLAFHIQALRAHEEHALGETAKSGKRRASAVGISLLAAFSVAALFFFASAVRLAPGASASIWRYLAKTVLDGAGTCETICTDGALKPLLELEAAERGVRLSVVPAGDSVFRHGVPPRLVAATRDPGQWTDAGEPVAVNGIVFCGEGGRAAANIDEMLKAWIAVSDKSVGKFRRARRRGETAAKAARILGNCVVATGGELARRLAGAGKREEARMVVAKALRFKPSSPMLALSALSLYGTGAEVYGIKAVKTPLAGAIGTEAGLAELARAETLPVDSVTEVFLAPGFVRLGSPARAFAALNRAGVAAGEAWREFKPGIAAVAGRVALLEGDRDVAKRFFKEALALSGGGDRTAAFALEFLFAPVARTDEDFAAHAKRLSALGATPEALLMDRCRFTERGGAPVLARMLIDRQIRDDEENTLLRIMRFERAIDDTAAATDRDYRRRRRAAAAEDYEKLRENPGAWRVRIALDSARMWLIDGDAALARSELAAAAIDFPKETRILRPLISLDGAIGLADSKRGHLEDLCRCDATVAAAVASCGVEDALDMFPDAPPDQASLLRATLEEEFFARFHDGDRAAEYGGAAAVCAKEYSAAKTAFDTVFHSEAMIPED
ncbi:MAG: hypothetical protein IJS46_06430, partial [Kiritimatiellae bacterium]|nr:hypothetical protein [Kiritimatiellia bacterium]